MDLIIGAGVTGLSYAAFCTHKDYLILEESNQIGGYCKTTIRNGYVWDYSGHFFHFQDEKLKEFIFDKMNKDDLLHIIKCTNIKYKDNTIDYPFQMNIHQLSKEELIDCLYDLFEKNQVDYSTFKEMLYCKFGKAISEKFLIPYNSKLYACDLDNLDKDAMGRFFPYAEKDDIIRNFKRKTNTSYNGTFVYPKGGAFEYIRSILSHVDESKIRTNCKVIQVDKENKFVVLESGEKLYYDNLISTIPFPQLLTTTSIEYDQTTYSWNKVLVFNIGFDKKGVDTTTHWSYFPENKYCFYRVGFYDNIMSADKMSLYVEIGYNKDEIIDSEYMFEKVVEDLKEAKIMDHNQTIVDYETIVMNPAYVHISSTSNNNVNSVKESLSRYSIYSIGRYGSWTYCSIEDNIKEAYLLTQILNIKK